MFGIGMPEMILILALALIVVGPDKLPDLARSLAKGIMELKKTAENLKESFSEEGNPLDEFRPDLEEAAKSLKQNLLDTPPYKRDNTIEPTGVNPPADNAAKAYQELIDKTTDNPHKSQDDPQKSIDTEEPEATHQETGDPPPVNHMKDNAATEPPKP
ncbi:MAG: twin-arginine translocase TatA/TatE family subunit [Desulforhopalus sp.]